MEITVFVNEENNIAPDYYGYKGGFASITKCKDCGSVGLREDQHPINPCANCGGRIVGCGAGKWEKGSYFEKGKWLIRKK